MKDVDDFLDELAAAADRGESLRSRVDAARFTPVRLREGYDMGEVDEFLERMARESAAGAVHAPDPASPRPVSPDPGVIEENRGLLGRLFGGRS